MLGAPVALTLSSSGNDSDLFVSPDGLTLWFVRQNDIYAGTRSNIRTISPLPAATITRSCSCV